MNFEHPKYNRGNLYLSGGMQFASGKGSGWRSDITPALKEAGYFPLDIVELDREYAKEYGELYGVNVHETHCQLKSNIREHFVRTDLDLIEYNSDGIVVLYDESVRRGAGTVAECQHAYNLNLPIFLVSTFKDWENEVPLWLQALTTKIFTDFDSLLDYLNELPYGILKKDRYGNHHDGKGNYFCFLSGQVFKKRKHHFVSNVSPLYSHNCVDLVANTREKQVDRYDFFVRSLKRAALED